MEMEFEYEIIRKEIKHARINVNEHKKVKLIVPNQFTEQEIELLLKQKEFWILKNIADFENEEKYNIKIPDGHILYLGKATLPPKTDILIWYKKQAKELITKETKRLSQKNGFNYNRIFIRNSKTKWGNCSVKKNLSFNWRLIKAPIEIVQYVILHELCHTLILNHNQAFWLKLRSVCSDYQANASWLKKYGKSLF